MASCCSTGLSWCFDGPCCESARNLSGASPTQWQTFKNGVSMPTEIGAPRLEFQRGEQSVGMNAEPEIMPSCMQTRASYVKYQQEQGVEQHSSLQAETGRYEPDDFLPDPEADLTWHQIGAIMLGNVVPNMFVLVFFSDMGLALDYYVAVAPTHVSLLGDCLISGAAFFLALFYILDLPRWPKRAMAMAGIWFDMLLTAGVLCKARKYPWGPILLVIFHIPLTMGVLRKTLCRFAKRRSFYSAIGSCAALCAFGVLLAWILWILIGDHQWTRETKDSLIAESADLYKYVYKKPGLIYERDCGANRDLSAYSNQEKKKIRKACASANTIWFLAWSSPLIAIFCDTIMAVFCLMQAFMLDLGDTSKIEKLLQQFILLLVVMLVGIYSSASVSGASLRLGSGLAAFFAAGLAILVVWAYIEIGKHLLEKRIKESMMTKLVLGFWTSDWARAVMVGGLNVFIPSYFVLNYLKQRYLQCTTPQTTMSSSRFTPAATKLLEQMSAWKWASILSKINVLGELFFCFQVGVSKVTYIFLSWMNEELGSLDYGIVITLVALIGYTMFLLPPVPGVPVYIFSGIVVAERGRKVDSIGFHAGCWIAVAVGFCLKILACLGQYAIGYGLGKSVKIQQLIGVDKVATRAIESILRRPGLDPGKVAILVGGPDWPTSVTCGILKLNIFQMLLGTCPVLFVLAPCVLAGAFMSRVTGGEDSIWNTLASTAIGFSFLIQMASMCTATYYITTVIQKHGSELSKPRPEHEVVAELTRSEAKYREFYATVIDWRSLSFCQRYFIKTSTYLMLLSCFIFLTISDCFKPFNVSSKISDPEDKDGLDGDPFNIVNPIGWFALTIFFIACLLHYIFIKKMERGAKSLMAAHS